MFHRKHFKAAQSDFASYASPEIVPSTFCTIFPTTIRRQNNLMLKSLSKFLEMMVIVAAFKLKKLIWPLCAQATWIQYFYDRVMRSK